MESRHTNMESRGQSVGSTDQGHDHPVLRLALRRPNPRALAAERIEAQGRIAQVPCTRCYIRGTLCLVGSTAKKCAACSRSGVTLAGCGVDRDNYREFPAEDEEDLDEEDTDDEEESSSNEASTGSEPDDDPMEGVSKTGQHPNLSVAGGESSRASHPNAQHSKVPLARKVEWVNRKTIELLIPVGSNMADVKDLIPALKNSAKQLRNRLRSLEEMVATLDATRPECR